MEDGYETELSQQARAAVQQHAFEEKVYYEARFRHLEANLQRRQALHNHNLEEKAIAQSRRLCQQWKSQSSTTGRPRKENPSFLLPISNRNCNTI